MKPTHVAGYYDEVRGSFSVERVHPLDFVEAGDLDVMEVHYRKGSRAPRVGERLAVWTDVSTSYAMALRGSR